VQPAQKVKVFWFFSSEKNTLGYACLAQSAASAIVLRACTFFT
jgi:hypothetical protein